MVFVCGRANDNAEQVLSQGEYLRVSGLLHELLCSVCDQAHDRCHKLLVARSRVDIQCLAYCLHTPACLSESLVHVMHSLNLKSFSALSLFAVDRNGISAVKILYHLSPKFLFQNVAEENHGRNG